MSRLGQTQNLLRQLYVKMSSAAGFKVAEAVTPSGLIPRPPNLYNISDRKFKMFERAGAINAIIFGVLWWWFVVERHARIRDEYEKNYDGDEHFESMRQKGMFHWAEPDPK